MNIDGQKVGTSVIPSGLDAREIVRLSQGACHALTEDEDGLKRDILGHSGNRWSLGVVHALGVTSPLRHAQLRRQLHGVSQRMLTRTLRQLERDGLITRHDFCEKPLRVEYALTELGMGLLVQMIPLWTWVIEQSESFRKARDRYEESERSDSALDVDC
ncbi:helix-turn-helix domain-containing protein [Pseudomonas coleopterorum]|uniref:winged helix-turn-helix transcriptional regulator n=1 Tax=Pseudomonas coleopterorum TaxID=1605838 RepID=UPI002A6A5113|nr:helix-turn-helix domain-containing protein [Pseudomonas coleopterorum]MDY1016377.1 helix-turn-helix domain-containing protein [Pseudomonas coleopterorum]